MLAAENTWCPRGLFSAKLPRGNKRLVQFMLTKKKKKKEQPDWNKFGIKLPVGGWEGRERTKENPNEVWKGVK